MHLTKFYFVLFNLLFYLEIKVKLCEGYFYTQRDSTDLSSTHMVQKFDLIVTYP